MKSCYLCGKPLASKADRTKDHVPPECIFPSEKPPNLLTLPCCRDCNSKYGKLDERMRNYLAILAATASGDAGDKARREVLRSPRGVADFLQHTRPHPTLTDPKGEPRHLFFFNDDELRDWLCRIVKGLYFAKAGERLSDATQYSVRKHPEVTPQSSLSFPMEDGLQFRPHFTYGRVPDVREVVWFLIFYDALMFSVAVQPPEEATQPNNSLEPTSTAGEKGDSNGH